MSSNAGWVAICLLAMASGADAQTTVYKCTSDGGTVYSDQPCDVGGADMKVLHLEPTPPPDTAEIQRRATVREKMAEKSRQGDLTRRELVCIENRTAPTRQGTRRRISGYQRQIDRLADGIGAAGDLATVTRANGIREQIASLQASINTEKGILAQTELNARSICARQRAASHTAEAD